MYTVSEKHAQMYMEHARVAADPKHNSCLSRAVGAVLVKLDRPGGRIVNTGFNGPATGMPRCDTAEHLAHAVWPQLRDEELHRIGFVGHQLDPHRETANRDQFVSKFAGCGQCPRRVIGAAAGERLELCSCAHAERNAIQRCTENVDGGHMYAWCSVPCHECSVAIMQAGISKLICLYTRQPDYSPGSRWYLRRKGVVIELRNPTTLDVVEVLEPLPAEETTCPALSA